MYWEVMMSQTFNYQKLLNDNSNDKQHSLSPCSVLATVTSILHAPGSFPVGGALEAKALEVKILAPDYGSAEAACREFS